MKVELGDRFVPQWDLNSGEWEARSREELGMVRVVRLNGRGTRTIAKEVLLDERQWLRVSK